MKSPIRTLSAALLAAVSFMPALFAQSAVNLGMQVPFAFQYGSQRFAGGACRMQLLRPDFLQLRCGSRAAMAMVRDEPESRGARPGHVVFRKYGDRYFLVEIWAGGSSTHLTVYESKWEKQAAQKLLASNGQTPTLVELALLDPAPGAKR